MSSERELLITFARSVENTAPGTLSHRSRLKYLETVLSLTLAIGLLFRVRFLWHHAGVLLRRLPKRLCHSRYPFLRRCFERRNVYRIFRVLEHQAFVRHSFAGPNRPDAVDAFELCFCPHL